MTVSQIPSALGPTNKRAAKRGLTLIEIMIALTMTLIVLGAMMSAFRYASEKMQQGRGVMEMANRLRSAEELLRNDLANLTLDPRVYTESTAPNGFLEIIEGVGNDSFFAAAPATSYLGDVDDAIGMTVRSAEGRRFRGTLQDAAAPQVIESTLAEVWYYTSLNDVTGSAVVATSAATIDIEDSVRLHRRALLIRPDFNVGGVLVLNGVAQTGLTLAQVNTFVANNDISVRVEPDGAGTFSIVANSLADLAVRRNRFAHALGAFPNRFSLSNTGGPPTAALALARSKPNGEDILLTDVAGFDVRVYSPNATVGYTQANNQGILVQPGDPGYASLGTLPSTATAGAYVDLGYGNGIAGVGAGEWFASLGSGTTNLPQPLPRVFDTWSPSYENDGIDQDGDTMIDEGTNGLNDGGSAAPDDDLERETRPPYPNPIRGIQISTRLRERTTQQMFQSSVIQSYVPE